MDRIILTVKPPLVEWRRHLGVPVAVINWSVEPVPADEIPGEVCAGPDCTEA